MKLELFLSHADADNEEALPEGLAAATVAVARPDQPGPTSAVSFPDEGGEINSLEDQRWGVVVPEGAEGTRLLSVLAPLIRKRQAEQGGHPVRVYRVPPGMSGDETTDWKINVLEAQDVDLIEVPRYLMILGGPEAVSLDFQSVMSTRAFTGRLAFDKDADYEAYTEKILRWEAAPKVAYKPKALLYTARDGSAATTAAYDLVMSNLVRELEAKQKTGKLNVDELLHAGELFNSDPGLLMTPAARPHPSVVFTMSHGLGAPRGGWKTRAEREAQQGALKTGRGSHLEAQDFATGKFAPGGLWFFFACFGLGTPVASDYTPWLRKLRNNNAFGGRLDAVLEGLPAPGDPPFFAGIPKAALANPDGPLAVLGHIDLAWSYSFQDLSKDSDARFRRFQRTIELLTGCRAGLALNSFLATAQDIGGQLSDQAHALAQAQELGIQPTVNEIRAGHQWMRLRDLRGYMLLGDPAARLPEGPSPAGAVVHEPGPPELITVDAKGSAQAPSTETASNFSSEDEPEQTPAPAAASAPAPTRSAPNVAEIEQAVIQLLRGSVRPEELEARLGVDYRTLLRWQQVMLDAGRAALVGLKA